MTEVERIQYIKRKLDDIERRIDAGATPQPRAKRGWLLRVFTKEVIPLAK